MASSAPDWGFSWWIKAGGPSRVCRSRCSSAMTFLLALQAFFSTQRRSISSRGTCESGEDQLRRWRAQLRRTHVLGLRQEQDDVDDRDRLHKAEEDVDSVAHLREHLRVGEGSAHLLGAGIRAIWHTVGVKRAMIKFCRSIDESAFCFCKQQGRFMAQDENEPTLGEGLG